MDERGIATRDQIELSIREVIEGERGKGVKRNSVRWKELTNKEVLDEGGSSDKNIVTVWIPLNPAFVFSKFYVFLLFFFFFFARIC